LGEPEAVPTASLGALLVAVAVGSIVFGLAFGRFLVYFGAGLLIVSLGMVVRELLAERRQRRAWAHRERR
jgi:high-affinity Fe2+/Pb2+ permease